MEPVLLLPDIINEKEEYKVEEVQNHRKQGCNMQFLVYQKKYGNEHNQQIAEMGLSYTKEMI